MAIDSRQLALFLRSVELGSFSQCAEHSFLTRSNVKRQIDALESQVGVPLFMRDTQGVRLTPAGELFYARAKHVLSALESAVEEARELGARKTIRMAFNTVAPTPHLHGIMDQFSAAFPNCDLELIPTVARDFIPALLEGRCDICEFTQIPEDSLQGQGLLFTPLFLVPLRCLVRAQHGLAKRQSIRLCELRGFRVGGNAYRYPSLVRKMEQDGIEFLDLPIDTAGLSKIMSFIQTGGCFIFPQTVRHLFAESFAAIELDDPDAVQQAGLITREDPPAHLQSLIELFKGNQLQRWY